MSVKVEHISIVICFIRFVFIVWQVEGYRNMLKLSCRPLALASYQAFLKNKKRLELFFLPHFPHNFWTKIFLLLYSINWPNLIVWLPLLWEILGNICFAIVCKPGCDVMKFEVNHIFLIKPLFLHNKNVVTKTKISWEGKGL